MVLIKDWRERTPLGVQRLLRLVRMPLRLLATEVFSCDEDTHAIFHSGGKIRQGGMQVLGAGIQGEEGGLKMTAVVAGVEEGEQGGASPTGGGGAVDFVDGEEGVVPVGAQEVGLGGWGHGNGVGAEAAPAVGNGFAACPRKDRGCDYDN